LQIPVTVSGIDAKGHIFREKTVVLGLHGRDCQYQSKHEVRVDSAILLDLDYSGTGQEPCRVQGRVKSLRTPRAEPGLFQIDVELDALQTLTIVPRDPEDPLRKQGTPIPEPLTAATEPQGMATLPSPRREPVPPDRAGGDPLGQTSTGPEAATVESHESLARLKAQNLAITREAVQAAVASEMSDRLEALKNSLSGQIDKSVQAAVGSRMEQMIHNAVEKQMAAQYEAGIQLLRADLTDHLAERLSESNELGGALKGMAAVLAERLRELLQTAATKIEKEQNARTLAIRQSIEAQITEMQGRMNETQTELGAMLSRAQAVDNDVNEALARVQKAIAQLGEADRIAAESTAERLSLQLNAWSAEFDKRLEQVAAERTACLVSGMERQMLPSLQRANEALEMLGAGLHLAQTHQDRLAELSRTATANFEKELRSFLLRLASNA
jgi:hypothetical protein